MSKNIRDLFFNGCYETILNSKINYYDGEDIYYLIMSHQSLHNTKKALETYYKYRKIVENWDLISSIKELLTLLAKTRNYRQIEIEKEYFINLPYKNQQTEEFLNSLDNTIKKLIDEIENSKNNLDFIDSISISDIKNKLFSNNQIDKYNALHKIFAMRIENVILDDLVIEYLNSPQPFDVVYVLLLEYVILDKVDRNITFRKENNYFIIKPVDYFDYIEESEIYIKNKLDYLSRTLKNLSIYFYIKRLMIPSFLNMFPKKLDKKMIDDLFYACYLVGCKIYGTDESDEEYFQNIKVDDKSSKKYVELILEIENSLKF